MSGPKDALELLCQHRSLWRAWWFPLVLLVALTLLLAPLLAPIKAAFRYNPCITIAVLFVLYLAVLTAWLILRLPPRNRRNTIGFAVAVNCEDPSYLIQFQNDFVGVLRDSLRHAQTHPTFRLIVVPPYYAAKIAVENASQYLAKCRAHFLLYGRVRNRLVNGLETFVLDLDAVVRHRRLPVEMKEEFRKHIESFWMKHIHVPRIHELAGMEATSKSLAVIAKYIIAKAALLSHSPDFALQILAEIRPSVDSGLLPTPCRSVISKAIPDLMVTAHLLKHLLAYMEWRRTRDRSHLQTIVDAADNALAISPKNHMGLVAKALASFALERDCAEARRLLTSAKAIVPKNGIVLFDLGFLCAYEGDALAAEHLFHKGRHLEWSDSTPWELEEYATWLLEEERNRTTLYYWLGLVNGFLKGDYSQAVQDFSDFLRKARPSTKERASAQAHIKKCRALLEKKGKAGRRRSPKRTRGKRAK